MIVSSEYPYTCYLNNEIVNEVVNSELINCILINSRYNDREEHYNKLIEFLCHNYRISHAS